jgi:[ribosomal protein S18]-alanine N-acetyltransferase
VARIFLEVSAENPAAIALYQKLGYLQTGKRLRYYQPPAGPSIDALIMSVTLIASKP